MVINPKLEIKNVLPHGRVIHVTKEGINGLPIEFGLHTAEVPFQGEENFRELLILFSNSC